MSAQVVLKKLAPRCRRSKRPPLQVPVFIYGPSADGEPFRDVTRTLTVNAHGGLLLLSAAIRQGETILLVNNLTHESQACRAAYIGPEQDGAREVGVEFIRPAPNFWKVHFPGLPRTAG